jgi:hypothetical protein
MPAFNASGASEHHTEKEPQFLNQLYFDALVFTPYAGGGELAAELVIARHKPPPRPSALFTPLRRAARGLGRVQGRMMGVRRAR